MTGTWDKIDILDYEAFFAFKKCSVNWVWIESILWKLQTPFILWFWINPLEEGAYGKCWISALVVTEETCIFYLDFCILDQ